MLLLSVRLAIWFVYRLVNDAIISAIFFALAPAQTLSIVTLLLAIIASAIAFVAILIYNFEGCSGKNMYSHDLCDLEWFHDVWISPSNHLTVSL